MQPAVLVRLVREMSRSRAAEEIYQPALTALKDLVGVERSSILLLDAGGVARFVAWRGLSDGYRAAVEGHFPWLLDDPAPRPILCEDIELDGSLAAHRDVFEREGVRALGFIPLVYGERLVGKFMLYFEHAHTFTREEVELANAVAYLVAFAIERVRLYADLKAADERKDRFLATLAHELRNPLAPVSAALEVVASRPDDLASFQRARPVIERNVRQMVKLIDDLLDVSRITRGVVTIDKQPADLASIVHQAVRSVDALIAKQRQELTLSLEPLWLDGDPLRLEQVITNLVNNAAKYTPQGGHIRVSVGASDGGVEIRVKDDGIGIEPELIPHLFDLFVQIDKSLARTRGGLGIGLTIVRELVELHGGTVSATSEGAGRGTEFTVWLPGRIPAPRDAPLAADAAPGPHRRILVVDDNEDAAAMLADLLQAWGHEVSTVGDGPAALAAVAEQHPEMVLLDLGLPGMSGYEVAQRLRASGEKDLRIVAVSGYGQPEDIARARAAGCDAHLAKPVDLVALEHLLADAHT